MACSDVHGNSGSPRIDVKTGPMIVEYSRRVCLTSVPLAWRTWTVTLSVVISRGEPSYMYVVGEPGTSWSSNGVKRNAVDTVWLHAMLSVWPMLTAGTPNRLPPTTLSLLGIVAWNS